MKQQHYDLITVGGGSGGSYVDSGLEWQEAS